MELEDEDLDVSLDTLPVELVLKICSFIPSRYLLEKVRLVNKHLHRVLSNEATWKIRIRKNLHNYPPIEPPNNYQFSRACVEIEENYAFWKGYTSSVVFRNESIAQASGISKGDVGLDTQARKLVTTAQGEESVKVSTTAQAQSTSGYRDKLACSSSATSATHALASAPAPLPAPFPSPAQCSSPDGAQSSSRVDMAPPFLELRDQIACIDAVHLFGGSYLATGSRDRSIMLYNIENKSVLYHKNLAHKGWIWSLESSKENRGVLVSGGWDCLVKVWDLNANFTLINEFKCNAVCLAVANYQNVIVAAGFDKLIHIFDVREKMGQTAHAHARGAYKAHRKAVLSVGINEKTIVSCGEDGFVAFYDRVAGKVAKRVKLSGSRNYPKSLSFGSGWLDVFYVGDIQGSVHLFDGKKQAVEATYEKVHERAVQGIFHNRGTLLTCSSDGILKVHQPSRDIKLIRAIPFTKVELPKVSSGSGRVAVGGGDGVTRVWEVNPRLR